MKRRLPLLAICMLVSMAAWCADGDVFTAKTVEGVTMTFKVTSEANKECQVGDDEPNSASVAKSTAGAVTIPSNVNGYSVKSLGNKAFFECSNITTLIIPNSITSIGEYNQEIMGKTNVEIIPVIA